MLKKLKLSIFVLTFLFVSLFSASSLDLSNANSSLGDMFESFIDPNEGMTVFRSLNIPIGGRTESLGTACVAVCDDITFFDYNPAASSVLNETEIALFHNAWISDSAMETLAFTSRTGNFGYGAQVKCFYVPFTEYNLFGDRVAGSYYTESFAALNFSYNFFSGYNFRGLALGFSPKIAWRNVPDYTDNKTDEIISGSGLKQSALAIMSDVGMLLRFNFFKGFANRNPNLNFGFSISNIGAAFTGFGDSIELDDSLPTRANLGIAYRIFAPILLTAEFRKPINIFDFSSSGIWSACAGLEVSVTRFFDFDMGFLLQGGNPRFSMGSGFEVRFLKLNVNYTFDLTSSQNPVNHISLSAKVKLGDKGRKKIQDAVDLHYINGLNLYANGDIQGAIKQWEKAIALDKTFDPAIEARNIALRFEKAKEDIMNAQKLDINISDKK